MLMVMLPPHGKVERKWAVLLAATLSFAVVYGFTTWSFGGVISAASGQVAGPRLAAAAVALAVTLMGLGQMIGPIVAGLVADPDGSFTRAFAIASVADAAGAVGMLLIRLPRSAPTEPA